jgi:hypothetical protein
MIRFATPAAVAALVCSLILCNPAGAQISATRLEGVILKGSGGPFPGAEVTAVQDGTVYRVQVLSDAAGRYVFQTLPPGTYGLTVSAKGFRPSTRTGIALGLSAAVTEDFTLEPGTPAEAESEEAPRDRLNTSDSEISGAFTRRELEVLPQLNRNPSELFVYQPGILIQGGNPASSGVSGTGKASNNMTIDAMDVNDTVDPSLAVPGILVNSDSVEQFRMILGGAGAQYGRSAGAQVMMDTRPGGNRWSGDLYDYFRDESLNANDFFNNAADIHRPSFNQNIFGVSLGGPLRKDRTLVFGNYQGRRTFEKLVRNRTVLTKEAKSGLFQWIWPLGTDAQTFDIVQNDPRKLGIDPNIASLLKQMPEKNNTDIGDGLNTGGYRFEGNNDSSSDQVTLRADHNLSSTHSLFARYGWGRSRAVDALHSAEATYPDQAEGTARARQWGFSVGSDWSVNTRMVNQLRAGYQSMKFNLDRPARTAGPMFLSDLWSDVLDPSFARWRHAPVATITDNLAVIRGAHALKAGFTFRYISQRSHDETGMYPDVTFGRDHGNIPPSTIGPSGNAISRADRETFEALYNNLLGRMESVSQTFYSDLNSFSAGGTPRTRNLVFREYEAFLQDDWKIRPNLTLNLGIRYEFSGAPSEKNDILGALDKADAVTSSANISDFTLLRGSSWYKNDLNNFAPRAGFAWAPWSSTRMILRGGFGIYFDRLAGAAANFVDNNTPGSSLTVTAYPYPSGNDLRLGDGIPPIQKPDSVLLKLPNSRSATIAIFNSDLETPYVQRFHLALQREIFGMFIEAAYMGERGENLFRNLNLNQLKTEGDFVTAFKELQKYRSSGTPVSSTNTLVRIFGSVNAAVSAIGGTALDLGLAGDAANTVDRYYYGKYTAAGVSDYYLRNYPQYDQFIMGTNEGSSSYDSFQLSIRRTSEHLKVIGSYTFSKSLDDFSASGELAAVPLDSFDPQRDKTVSSWNRTHVINGWLVYSLPWRQEEEADAGWLGSFLSGWDIGVLGVWETGPRFTVTSGRETVRSGVDSLAVYTGAHNIGSIIRESAGVYYFTGDEARSFSMPAAGDMGSSIYNVFRGPSYRSFDVSLSKNLRVRGDERLTIRAEVYNVLNRANFGLPGTNLSDPRTFGVISSTQGYPRQLQIALRYRF